MTTSTVEPVRALKGGDDPHARRRLMHVMIAAQVAFCFLVVFVGGLFTTTFHRLTNRPLGFDPAQLLLLETVAPDGRTPEAWAQMAETLRALPEVQDVAESGWPLLSSGAWNGFISIRGGPPSHDWGYFLTISPGWLATMKMQLIAGRDFRQSDTFPGAAIVNETFVKEFLKSTDPLGMAFERVDNDGTRERCQVVGVVADAPYRLVREAILPVAFVPFRQMDAKGMAQLGYSATFVVRTRGKNPPTMGMTVRRGLAQAGFRVSNVQTQQELLDVQTVRERLLARLAIFFSVVALLLAGIGLYGVLDYSVLQRRREIGIRIALGAPAGGVVRTVGWEIFAMVVCGAVFGTGLGVAVARYVAALLYGVQPTQPDVLMGALFTVLATTVIAAILPVVRAVRLDPMEVLKVD